MTVVSNRWVAGMAAALLAASAGAAERKEMGNLVMEGMPEFERRFRVIVQPDETLSVSDLAESIN